MRQQAPDKDYFFDLLFDPGEFTIMADEFHKPQYLEFTYNNEWMNGDSGGNVYYQYFCINPLKSASKTDDNVAVYRNILLEFDKGTLTEQEEELLHSFLPFTTLTYSGNKSLHCIISLKEPLKSKEDYDYLVSKIYKVFPNCDPTCRNPSRYSRVSGSVNRKTGKEQSKVKHHARVDNEIGLMRWLEEMSSMFPEPKIVEVDFKNKPKKLATKMHLNTLTFLQFGAPEGSWNISLFKAAADLLRCGLSRDDIEERLTNISGYLDSKDLQTMRSAFKAVEKE